MRLGCEQSVFLPRVVEQEEDLTCVKCSVDLRHAGREMERDTNWPKPWHLSYTLCPQLKTLIGSFCATCLTFLGDLWMLKSDLVFWELYFVLRGQM